jgi:small subunit ribosomal protein S5
MGSSNPHNVVKATLAGLLSLRDARTVAKERGISLQELFQN